MQLMLDGVRLPELVWREAFRNPPLPYYYHYYLPQGKWELFIAGEPIEQMSDAAEIAKAGEVVLSGASPI